MTPMYWRKRIVAARGSRALVSCRYSISAKLPVKQLGRNGVHRLRPRSPRSSGAAAAGRGRRGVAVLEMQHTDLIVAGNRHLLERPLQALGRLQQLCAENSFFVTEAKIAPPPMRSSLTARRAT